MENEAHNGGQTVAARPRPVARWTTVLEAGRPRLVMTWSVPTAAAQATAATTRSAVRTAA